MSKEERAYRMVKILKDHRRSRGEKNNLWRSPTSAEVEYVMREMAEWEGRQ